MEPVNSSVLFLRTLTSTHMAKALLYLGSAPVYERKIVRNPMGLESAALTVVQTETIIFRGL